jgi:hypothetical protein
MTTAHSARSMRRRGSSSDGKKAPCLSFGIRSSRVAGLRGQQALAVAVSVRRPLGAALVRLGADLVGGLHVDQGLQHQLQPRER